MNKYTPASIFLSQCYVNANLCPGRNQVSCHMPSMASMWWYHITAIILVSLRFYWLYGAISMVQWYAHLQPNIHSDNFFTFSWANKIKVKPRNVHMFLDNHMKGVSPHNFQCSLQPWELLGGLPFKYHPEIICLVFWDQSSWLDTWLFICNCLYTIKLMSTLSNQIDRLSPGWSVPRTGLQVFQASTIILELNLSID